MVINALHSITIIGKHDGFALRDSLQKINERLDFVFVGTFHFKNSGAIAKAIVGVQKIDHHKIVDAHKLRDLR